MIDLPVNIPCGDFSETLANSYMIQCSNKYDGLNELNDDFTGVLSAPLNVQSNDNIVMNTETISSFYSKNQRNLKIAHLNINSVRHKFHPISDMLNKSLIDIMFIQETKLDSSFPNGQFVAQISH